MNRISITKYNPFFRDKNGRFQLNEWTSYSDIGKRFRDRILTKEDYLIVEKRYINAVLFIMNEFQVEKLKIDHIFKLSSKKEFQFKGDFELFNSYIHLEKGQILSNKTEIENLIKLRLREYIVELELILEGELDIAIHFGFDYYMYLISSENLSSLNSSIKELGLYIY